MAWSAPGRADLASAKLDAGIEASGPHDFTVRNNIVRLHARASLTGWTPPCDSDCAPTLPRPPHPLPNVRDDRETPLFRAGDGLDMELICVAGEANYFSQGD
jgi:hypothetical protein